MQMVIENLTRNRMETALIILAGGVCGVVYGKYIEPYIQKKNTQTGTYNCATAYIRLGVVFLGGMSLGATITITWVQLYLRKIAHENGIFI